MSKLALKAALDISPRSQPYEGFDQINGTHPWQSAVPDGYVLYNVRKIHGSKVRYFNFSLAEEMGLISQGHPRTLNPSLEKKILDAFSLHIINEYDLQQGTKFPKKDVKPHAYMATRYLQLQHSCKMGTTSGDGRSMWNGYFQGPQFTWDISSCGTGSTRLSPAFAASGKPIRTGDPNVSYGCGQAEVDEGLAAAILSEAFHSRGIHTERTLAVIECPKGNAINVRAEKNLLRPAHLFLHLKQGNHSSLKAGLDYYIRRQISNREWHGPASDPNKYDHFLELIAHQYAAFTAKLEDDYIFCWLDWDGDNMLMDGGIIDYGSIRQFGLFHHHYRYNDVDRYSTNIKEQKNKARRLVQTFAQLVDFVKTGKKKDIGYFHQAPCLKIFDGEFDRHKRTHLLRRLGLNSRQRERLMNNEPRLVEAFYKSYGYFEKKETSGTFRKTPDGINWPAAYDVRNLMRELPKHYLLTEKLMASDAFLQLLRSEWSSNALLRPNQYKHKKIVQFQRLYLEILKRGCTPSTPLRRTLLEAVMRAGTNNPKGQVTGDGIIYIVEALVKYRKRLPRKEFLKVIQQFIHTQSSRAPEKHRLSKKAQKLLLTFEEIIEETIFSV